MLLRFAFCFDNSYALPAAVSLHSLLRHAATKDAVYELNIIAGDLGENERRMLQRVAEPFGQARIVFHKPPDLPTELCRAISGKSHYSAALFHKILLPQLFEPHGRVVALDVDTVYLDDAAKLLEIDFHGCVAGAREPLYWGWRGEGPLGDNGPGTRHYKRRYSDSERSRMSLNAGVIIYDLAEIARQDAVARWLDFALANTHRLMLPEQDVMNLALDEPPFPLPWSICTYAPLAEFAVCSLQCAVVDMPHFSSGSENGREEKIAPSPTAHCKLQTANSILVHYTTKVKPWNDPGCRLAEFWFAELASAGLVEEWRRMFAVSSRPLFVWKYAKRLFELKLGRLRLSLFKERRK